MPDIAPDVVIVEAADPNGLLPLPAGAKPLVEAATPTERHLVVACGIARLRLCVRQEPHSLVPAFTIPCDANCALRLAATTRFQQAVLGRRSLHDAIAMPTRNQRFRLVRLLGVHDALEAGASSRDIAFDLILPNHRPLSGAVWKGSSERRQVLRLIADTRRLVTSGYRTLLLHR